MKNKRETKKKKMLNNLEFEPNLKAMFHGMSIREDKSKMKVPLEAYLVKFQQNSLWKWPFMKGLRAKDQG